jgi:hypothetical protein
VTVSLTPSSQPAEVVDAPGFISGLQSGWAAFASMILVGLTALGFLLPFLLVLLVILVPVVFILVRLVRRPHRTTVAVEQAAQPEPESTPSA